MNPLLRLGELGQSPWYDYITRDLIASGELARLIRDDGLRGMTSNPTIFEKAVAGSGSYDEDIRRLGREGRSPGEIFEALAVADVRAACDAFAELHRCTGGLDGQVSLEVSPEVANDTEATIHEAHRLWAAVERPNAMIKIPGTMAGLPAMTRCIADGISVNVTLLFSVERYAAVIEAWLAGMERRLERGEPPGTVASVASFFVSRVDAKVDPLLDASPLRGRIAIANAAAAYRLFEWSLGTPRWDRLAKAGAVIVSYEGGRDQLLGVLNGTLDLGIGELQELSAQLEGGQLRLLAVLTRERLPSHPELATAREQGVDVVVTKFRGLAGPKGLPPAVLEAWERGVRAVLADPAYRREYARDGLVPAPMGAAEARRFTVEFAGEVAESLRALGVLR